MIAKIIVGILIGGAVGAAVLAGWTYYDVVVNHKDMFGLAPVYLALWLGGFIGAGIGGIVAAPGSWRQR